MLNMEIHRLSYPLEVLDVIWINITIPNINHIIRFGDITWSRLICILSHYHAVKKNIQHHHTQAFVTRDFFCNIAFVQGKEMYDVEASITNLTFHS